MTTRTGPISSPPSIDLLTPAEAGVALGVDHDGLVDLINRDLLPAYVIAGAVRFRQREVTALISRLIPA